MLKELAVAFLDCVWLTALAVCTVCPIPDAQLVMSVAAGARVGVSIG